MLGNEYLRLLLGVKKKKKRKIRNETQPHVRPQWKPFHLAHCLISDLKAGLFCSFSYSPTRHLTHTSVESFFNTCTNIFVIAFHIGFPNSLQEEKGTKCISQKYSSTVVFLNYMWILFNLLVLRGWFSTYSTIIQLKKETAGEKESYEIGKNKTFTS